MRRAWVTIWGLRSHQQYMLLPPGEPAELEMLARREARVGQGPMGSLEMVEGVQVGTPRESVTGGRRPEVSYVSASADEVRLRLQPLADAGLSIEGVFTPALALASLARLRSTAATGSVAAVVSVNGDVTGLAVVRDGLVLFSREMPWGHETERAGNTGRMLDPTKFAEKLGSELRRSFLFVKQNFKVDVDQVALCGDFPDMRTVTAPLIDLLGLEVETLDSLEGFDLSRLPEPVEEFRGRVAELRLAWASAADQTASVNLLPKEARTKSTVRRIEVRGAAAVAAGVLLAVAGYAGADVLARRAAGQMTELRQQIAQLEPQVQKIEQDRQAAAMAQARNAALDAFGSQSARLTRVLEVIGKSAPNEVALTSLKLTPSGATWALTMAGESKASNPALAQAAFNAFLKAVAESPYLIQLRPATLKVSAAEEKGPDQKPAVIPEEPILRPVPLPPSDTRRSERDAQGRTVEWYHRLPEAHRRRDEMERTRRDVPRQTEFNARDRSETTYQGDGRPVVPATPPAPQPLATVSFSVDYEVRK